MTAQAMLGQTYTSHTDVWASLDERREVLHHHLTNRALSHKPPVEAYPGAIHSGRSSRPDCGCEESGDSGDSASSEYGETAGV